MKISKLFISFSNIKRTALIPSEENSLNTSDVIIYSIFLPHFIKLKSDLTAFLNATELQRAQRFYKEVDQNRFIIYRAILKFVLASHTKWDVNNISLDYHFNKKPYLASHPWLYFNVSHSEDYAVIAISRKKVGIDIEFMSEEFDFTSVLSDIFEANEILTIENSDDKIQTFYTSWTRKEAFVKALGKGIDEDFKYIPCSDGLHNIDSALLQNTKNWQVHSFYLAEQYLGAVAFEDSSTIAKNLKLYTVPNTMKDLLAMTQVRNG
jgi:4'-phosphopantetheinyl transferase